VVQYICHNNSFYNDFLYIFIFLLREVYERTKHKKTGDILFMAGEKGSYRLYTEIPKELSDNDEFKLVVNLPNNEGKSDRFVYHINSKAEE